MRHYSTLSEAEINSLTLVFPTTTNMALCLQYEINRAGLRKLALLHGWKKDRATMAIMKATAHYKRYRFRSTDYQSVVSWLSMMRNRLAD